MYKNYSKEKIMLLKEQYKKGDIVELLDDMDEEVHMFAGLRGKVQVVDSIGTVHVLWDNGRTLGLTSIDRFKKVVQLLFFYKENNKTTEERVVMQYSNFIKNYKNNGFEQNEEALEKLVNNVVTLLKKHLKHIGKNVNEEKIFKSLVDNYRTYKDKTKVNGKLAELNDLMKEFNVYRQKTSLTEDEKVNFVKNMMHIASTSIRVDIEFDRLHEQSIEKESVVQKSENFNEAEVSNEQVINFG